MRYSHLASLCAVACLISLGCQRGAPPQPVAKTSPPITEVKLLVGEPIQVKNLTIFPIESSQPRDDDRFITLDDGVRAGTVAVFELGALPGQPGASEPSLEPAADAADDPFNPVVEPAPEPVDATDVAQVPDDLFEPAADAEEAAAIAEEMPDDSEPAAADTAVDMPDDPFGDGPDVNRVVVVNKSDRPLYLMPGETIVGGQQDRVLAEETIIPPDGKPVVVGVYCVEHGRWSDRSMEETTARANVYPVADLVIGKTFAPGKSSLNKEARLAVQDAKDQGRVWDEVAKVNEQADTKSETGAFTSNFRGTEVAKDLKPYIDGLEQAITDRERVVGIVVAINGKVESMDVFESTPLFRKLWPKLIKGHALDAANATDDGDAEEIEKPCLVAEAQKFYDDATSGEIASTKANGQLVMTGRASKGIVSFSIDEGRRLPASAAGESMGGMGGMGGAMGGGVHTSGFSK
jgi:hypothetical protein